VLPTCKVAIALGRDLKDTFAMSDPPPLPSTPQVVKHPSMLAWWGIVPAVVYGVIQFIYGWPKAKLENPQAPIPYFFGSLVGGPLLALMLAWIVYRISKRTQFSATVVFTVIMIFGTLAVRVPVRPGSSQNPSAMSFGDFQFEAPANWKRTTPERPDQLAYLTALDAATAQPCAVLIVMGDTVPTGVTTRGSLMDLGAEFAPTKVWVDGCQGERIEVPNRSLPRHQVMVGVEHGQKYYVIMVSGLLETDISGPLDHVLSTWKWSVVP
jgi:hypothetical protein